MTIISSSWVEQLARKADRQLPEKQIKTLQTEKQIRETGNCLKPFSTQKLPMINLWILNDSLQRVADKPLEKTSKRICT